MRQVNPDPLASCVAVLGVQQLDNYSLKYSSGCHPGGWIDHADRRRLTRPSRSARSPPVRRRRRSSASATSTTQAPYTSSRCPARSASRSRAASTSSLAWPGVVSGVGEAHKVFWTQVLRPSPPTTMADRRKLPGERNQRLSFTEGAALR